MCVTSIGFGNKLPVNLRVLDIKPQKHGPTRPALVIARWYRKHFKSGNKIPIAQLRRHSNQVQCVYLSSTPGQVITVFLFFESELLIIASIKIKNASVLVNVIVHEISQRIYGLTLLLKGVP